MILNSGQCQRIALNMRQRWGWMRTEGLNLDQTISRSSTSSMRSVSPTTTIACMLGVANDLDWSRTRGFYQLVSANRASVQIVIQVLANALSLIHVTAICRLINYATRIHFSKTTISLDTLRAWVALSMAQMDWDLPIAWLLLFRGVFETWGIGISIRYLAQLWKGWQQVRMACPFLLTGSLPRFCQWLRLVRSEHRLSST
jgi:hypothetical protein